MKTEKKFIVNININDSKIFNNLLSQTSDQIIKVESLENDFTFDYIFKNDTNENEVFRNTAMNLINQALDGHNSGLIIYSLNKNLRKNSILSNLFFKSLDFLLNCNKMNISVYISVLNISNNKITDLLDLNRQVFIDDEYRLNNNEYIILANIDNYKEKLSKMLFDEYDSLVVILKVIRNNVESFFYLCDFLENSNNETIISSNLAKCINSFNKFGSRIPYQDSLITKILKEILFDYGRQACFVLPISMDLKFSNDSICALLFADKLTKLKTNNFIIKMNNTTEYNITTENINPNITEGSINYEKKLLLYEKKIQDLKKETIKLKEENKNLLLKVKEGNSLINNESKKNNVMKDFFIEKFEKEIQRQKKEILELKDKLKNNEELFPLDKINTTRSKINNTMVECIQVSSFYYENTNNSVFPNSENIQFKNILSSPISKLELNNSNNILINYNSDSSEDKNELLIMELKNEILQLKKILNQKIEKIKFYERELQPLLNNSKSVIKHSRNLSEINNDTKSRLSGKTGNTGISGKSEDVSKLDEMKQFLINSEKKKIELEKEIIDLKMLKEKAKNQKFTIIKSLERNQQILLNLYKTLKNIDCENKLNFNSQLFEEYDMINLNFSNYYKFLDKVRDINYIIQSENMIFDSMMIRSGSGTLFNAYNTFMQNIGTLLNTLIKALVVENTKNLYFTDSIFKIIKFYMLNKYNLGNTKDDLFNNLKNDKETFITNFDLYLKNIKYKILILNPKSS